jgi:hypothetical protein
MVVHTPQPDLAQRPGWQQLVLGQLVQQGLQLLWVLLQPL